MFDFILSMFNTTDIHKQIRLAAHSDTTINIECVSSDVIGGGIQS
jgi:hypothetical protein